MSYRPIGTLSAGAASHRRRRQPRQIGHLAHRGVLTTMGAHDRQRRDFEVFCQRQTSRAHALAQAGHRRYVDRVLKVIADTAPEVVFDAEACAVRIAGYGIGGAPSRRCEDD